MKTAFRSRRHRNPHTHDQEDPQSEKAFFSKSQESEASSTKAPFFQKNSSGGHSLPIQTKLAIGQPGDAYEREADEVADAVVHQDSRKPGIQQKKISSIQRLATPALEEKMGTNEERMKEDKLVQEKQEEEEPVQMQAEKEEEMPVQKAAEPEEEKPVQMEAAPEEEEPIQKAAAPEEEEPVQMQLAQEEEPVQKMDEPKEEEVSAPAVQPKSNGKSNSASPALSSRIESSKGKGDPLPANTRAEMESSFGTDFRDVRIHNDSEAVKMNKELGAHAFTTGQDIYFNQGKYNPESTEGKRLLAHELTHTVQQNNQRIQKQGTDTDPNLYVPGDNQWFDSQGEALQAAQFKLHELTILHGSVYQIEHHPLPVRGLPHYHVHHILNSKQNYNGHFFYRTKRRYRQYKVDWRSVYRVVVALGLSLAMIAVIIAALLDPEPASKLALAGLSVVMISSIMSMLSSEKKNEA